MSYHPYSRLAAIPQPSPSFYPSPPPYTMGSSPSAPPVRGQDFFLTSSSPAASIYTTPLPPPLSPPVPPHASLPPAPTLPSIAQLDLSPLTPSCSSPHPPLPSAQQLISQIDPSSIPQSSPSSISQTIPASPKPSRASSPSSPQKSKSFSFVIPASSDRLKAGGPKRTRRHPDQVERHYACSHPGCSKKYGTLNHLNAHVDTQGHGPRRLPSEFQELRRRLRQRNFRTVHAHAFSSSSSSS